MGLNVFGKIHTCGTTDWHSLVFRRHMANVLFHSHPLKSATPASHSSQSEIFMILEHTDFNVQEHLGGESSHG
jgi:hypothetical protein